MGTRYNLARRLLTVMTVGALVGASSGSSVADGGAAGWDVVATGLDNVRGMTIGPDGALYVAEAGKGDRANCVELGGGGPAGGTRCFGYSGAVTRVADGEQARIVTGLASSAGEDGTAATGPHDVAFHDGHLYVLVGLGANPADRAQIPGIGKDFGHLYRVADGVIEDVADVAQYEADEDPGGGRLDSNPYALDTHDGGFVVADAGGNALLAVGTDGSIETLATFPIIGEYPGPDGKNVPTESVPDAVAVAEDGTSYVGELTGFPFPKGGARVYTVPAGGGDPKVYAEGFTNIIDVELGPDGSLYVLEITTNGLLAAEAGGDGPPDPAAITGRLVRIAEDGEQTEMASEGLITPTSVEVSEDGEIYVANYGIAPPGQGQVVRLAAQPDMPSTGAGALGGAAVPLGPAAGAAALLATVAYAGVRRRR